MMAAAAGLLNHGGLSGGGAAEVQRSVVEISETQVLVGVDTKLEGHSGCSLSGTASEGKMPRC